MTTRTMLEKNRLGAAPRVYFRPEFQSCPHCSIKLRRTHTAWEKKIVTTNGTIHAWSMAYGCKNPECLKTGITYKSAEAEMLSMKHSSYGYDVLALVGELRFKQHRTVKEIADALNDREIPTSERHAQNLYERYQTLLAASLDDHVQKVLAETTEQNGGIILSMDGVQPEKGNEMLYVKFRPNRLCSSRVMESAAGMENRLNLEKKHLSTYQNESSISSMTLRRVFECTGRPYASFSAHKTAPVAGGTCSMMRCGDDIENG